MWVCQLCQRNFEDEEQKYEILTEELNRTFQGVVVIKANTIFSFLCDDCFQEYIKNQNINLEEV